MQKQNEKQYRAIIETHNLPIYYKPWWLDAVAGAANWDVIFYTDKNKVLGFWPYCFKNKLTFKKSFQPHLTPYLGPWLFYPEDQKEHERRSLEKKVIKNLIDQLPKFDDIRFRWHHRHDNALPFYWSGFEQTTQYTYILDNISDREEIYKNYKSTLKRQIRKGEKAALQVKSLRTILPCYDLFDASFSRQKSKNPLTLDMAKEVFKVCKQNRMGKVFGAYGLDDNLHAAIFVVWDQHSAYYLFGGYDDQYKESGAMSFLMDHAIKEMAQHVNTFDFEGSRIPSIERFFSGFGGKLTPVNFCWKTDSKILKRIS